MSREMGSDDHTTYWDYLRIAELLDGSLEAGEHRLFWSGRDRNGRAVPSGVYLVRVDGRRVSRTVKVQLVK